MHDSESRSDIKQARNSELRLNTMPLADLMQMQFPARRWVIRDLIGQGLWLLAGPPKARKSWLAQAIALAVARGGRVLGSMTAEQGEVLHLALEDDEERVQRRTRTLLGSDPPPSGYFVATRSADKTEDAIIDLGHWLHKHPGTRLVVIDTTAVFLRGRSKEDDGGGYESDYARFRSLKQMADKYRVCILALTHTRKATDHDGLNTVMGTTGVTGAADGIMVLRSKRFKTDGVLEVVGRDVLDRKLNLVFNNDSCQWQYTADAQGQAAVNAGRVISPEQQEVLDAIRDHGPMGPAELGRKLGKETSAIKMRLTRLRKADSLGNPPLLVSKDRKYHIADSSGFQVVDLTAGSEIDSVPAMHDW